MDIDGWINGEMLESSRLLVHSISKLDAPLRSRSVPPPTRRRDAHAHAKNNDLKRLLALCIFKRVKCTLGSRREHLGSVPCCPLLSSSLYESMEIAKSIRSNRTFFTFFLLFFLFFFFINIESSFIFIEGKSLSDSKKMKL